MHRVGLALLAPLLSLALLALAGEEALGHHHAFSEEDLTAHSLTVVDHTGEFEADPHYDRSADARHDACPACALSASPSAPSAASAQLARPSAQDAALLLGAAARLLEGGERDAPARGPPAA